MIRFATFHVPFASLFALLTVFLSLGTASAQSLGDYQISTVAEDLEGPWGVDLLPDGGFVVTEIAGRIWLFSPDGRRREVSGAPEVVVQGQGGLLDVTVARDFAETGEIFLTYAGRVEGGVGTLMAVARLDTANAALENLRVLWQMDQGTGGGRHFGSRVVEAPDGTLFVTVGERGEAELAQSLEHHNGKVVRVTRDGAVPKDMPFAHGALPDIYSYGHRNPQGAALDAQGRLWVVEHGARGGDEVNLVTPAGNYGWPVISYGRHYSGAKIGIGSAAPGMKQPRTYWDPSIAPSGLVIANGARPEWEGLFYVGSLKFDYIAVLDPATWREEKIRTRQTGRVRDLVQAPDGSIWFLSEDNGALYRIDPK